MRTVLRSGLLLLAAMAGLPALWAALWPLSFYRAYPTPAQGWIMMFPPYNEHMTYDFGLAILQFTVVLGYAAAVPRRGLVRVSLLASLVFSVPHFLYHQRHLVPGSDVLLQVATQLAPIVLALALLAINERSRAHPSRDETGAERSSTT